MSGIRAAPGWRRAVRGRRVNWRAGANRSDRGRVPGWGFPPRSGQVNQVPSGKIKWYDADKGFGFIAQDGGGDDVHVRSSALPTGVATLKPGQKVEYGVADGRRGPQALQVKVLDAPPSMVAANRRPAEELHGLVDDMIKLLESKALPELRRGRYPDRALGGRIAAVLRAVADRAGRLSRHPIAPGSAGRRSPR